MAFPEVRWGSRIFLITLLALTGCTKSVFKVREELRNNICDISTNQSSVRVSFQSLKISDSIIDGNVSQILESGEKWAVALITTDESSVLIEAGGPRTIPGFWTTDAYGYPMPLIVNVADKYEGLGGIYGAGQVPFGNRSNLSMDDAMARALDIAEDNCDALADEFAEAEGIRRNRLNCSRELARQICTAQNLNIGSEGRNRHTMGAHSQELDEI